MRDKDNFNNEKLIKESLKPERKTASQIQAESKPKQELTKEDWYNAGFEDGKAFPKPKQSWCECSEPYKIRYENDTCPKCDRDIKPQFCTCGKDLALPRSDGTCYRCGLKSQNATIKCDTSMDTKGTGCECKDGKLIPKEDFNYCPKCGGSLKSHETTYLAYDQKTKTHTPYKPQVTKSVTSVNEFCTCEKPMKVRDNSKMCLQCHLPIKPRKERR